MAIPFSNTHYRIPRGFGNLLEGLTREVLREQPKDIPDFAAKYFAELLKKREETGFDPAEWGAKLEDRFYNNYSFKEDQTSQNYQIKMKASTIIQAAYRGHLQRKEIKKMKSAPNVYPDVSKDNQEIDSEVSEKYEGLDMMVTGVMEGQRKSTAEKQDGASEPDEEREDKHPEANIETLTEHGFTVEEPEELETSSTQKDELSDDGEIIITLEETELNTETLEEHKGNFVEETKAYLVEEKSEESGQEGSSTPLYLQDDENETTAISQTEQGKSGFMEGHQATSEEEPTQ
ncbi:sperm surface protein Sp17 [Microcaecilia unicolor]|uniref:Sperm surface protein Sp17 n=1 Tax=Microcaecilia unicolor TaxID=1415580 RepID=A0A6P7ZMN9_9AMPH|nr:sperm surface protein Sp17 [Microcaecilia unicolor]XP_030076455.1 sperm surface protein Sp17 [Microcaecilia unicolor]XP_030076456.1 sperm surface protein Sp17 [Microcaecilia unicolor]XP_030076458.1 sperm surface protein Sp17 [Microcaecilia unicolor]